MNKKIFLAVTAAFLLNSTMAQAEVKTFNFTYSGAKYSNSAIATGFITLDTDFITSEPQIDLPVNQIVDLGMTVTNSDSGNGVFTKSDFSKIWIHSSGPLDFSRELVGQTLEYGNQFGISMAGSFVLWRSNSSAPTASYYNEMTTSAGEKMNLISMSVAAVPEADTSAMLLMGVGVMGFIARRRKNTQA
jgi:hypothetical protein